MGNPIIDPHRELREPPKSGLDPSVSYYAIAKSYSDYLNWRRFNPGFHVSYLTKERAEQLLTLGYERRPLLRLAGWESSEARELAERLEG